MEVFKEGEGLISLGPPYVLGAKEVDESVLLLPCAARQCFTAKALAHRDRFLFLSFSFSRFCRPPGMPRTEGEFAKRASAVEWFQARYGR
jgi:hypothetical protein